MVWPGTVQAQLGGLVDTTTSTVTNTTSSTTSTLTDTTSTLTGTIGTVLGTTTVLSGTGTLVAGTSDALQASELTAGVPSLLTGEVLHAVTIGYPDQIDSEASLAALALNVAGINIGADFVMARALAAINATPIGTSNIDSLSINGVPFSVTGEPNQMISVAGGVVVLNEQQTLPDGTLVVNALHAIVSGVADVVVGSAMAGYSGGQASAVKASY
ncbi:MAG: choice-of-anchor P family protein [Nitrospirales bacterium]